MIKMINKFNALPLKEKVMYVAALVMAVIIYIAFIISPLVGKLNRSNATLSDVRENKAKIEAALKEYRSLPNVKIHKRTESLLSLVEKKSSVSSIAKNIVYLKPFTASTRGLEGAEIKLNNVAGPDLIDFIHKLYGNHINITKASFKDNDLDGLWTVRLFLEG